METKNKLIIGITGGIGSGKTTFANLLEKKSCKVIYSDVLAKKVINESKRIQFKLMEKFGMHTFVNGEYNSEYIAFLVFSDKSRLHTLNQIVIPPVIDEIIKEIEAIDDSYRLVFVESALIYELELEKGFDYVISVSAKIENRKQRISEHFEKRMKSQLTQEEKNSLSDFVIENNKDIPELEKAADSIIKILELLPNRVYEDEEEDFTDETDETNDY
jgi:dephospho-CoA kinase